MAWQHPIAAGESPVEQWGGFRGTGVVKIIKYFILRHWRRNQGDQKIVRGGGGGFAQILDKVAKTVA